MAKITFTCVSCGSTLEADAGSAWAAMTCPHCGTVSTVPELKPQDYTEAQLGPPRPLGRDGTVPLMCPRADCGHLNQPRARFCARCGRDLSAAQERATAAAAPKADPSSVLSLPYLFFRPQRFFECFAACANTVTVACAAWVAGITGAMDQIAVRSLLGGRGQPALDSWVEYWITVCIGGVIAGAVGVYLIGGWWYGVRLKWSGAIEPDKRLARRVYIFAALTVSLPALGVAVVDALVFPTPLKADEDLSGWGLVLDWAIVLLLFWSVYVSYRGGRTLFGLRRWRARFWLFIFPSVWYLLILGGVGAFAAFFTKEFIDRPGFSLTCPPGWFIDDEADGYDPDHYFTIEPFAHDALVTFVITDSSVDIDDLRDELLRNYREAFRGGSEKRFSRWGKYLGTGAEYFGTLAGNRYQISVFAGSTRFRSFAVVEVVDVQSAEAVESGFELIRRSFRFKP